MAYPNTTQIQNARLSLRSHFLNIAIADGYWNDFTQELAEQVFYGLATSAIDHSIPRIYISPVLRTMDPISMRRADYNRESPGDGPFVGIVGKQRIEFDCVGVSEIDGQDAYLTRERLAQDMETVLGLWAPVTSIAPVLDQLLITEMSFGADEIQREAGITTDGVCRLRVAIDWTPLDEG